MIDVRCAVVALRYLSAESRSGAAGIPWSASLAALSWGAATARDARDSFPVVAAPASSGTTGGTVAPIAANANRNDQVTALRYGRRKPRSLTNVRMLHKV